MFRGMRREKKALTQEQCVAIMNKGNYGVLSVMSENGYPYGIPINYVYHKGSIFLHCAYEGQKVDAIKHNDKVSFCVVGEDRVIEEKFSTSYESVILFGKAITVEEEVEKKDALMALIKRFSPHFIESGSDYVNRSWAKTNVIKIEIDHITGKGNVD